MDCASKVPASTPSKAVHAPPQLSIRITKFPCPPSVNRLYIYGNQRVQKSNEYRNYETAVAFWRAANMAQVESLATFAKQLDGKVVHIDATFHMLKGSILCKNGKPKRNDTSNRLKALHDVICNSIIEIDDSYFWSGSFNKVAVDGDTEHVDIVLTFRDI